MGFTEILTIVFIVLKVLNKIDWSWWLVLLPEIIASVLYLIVFVLGVASNVRIHKQLRKHFNKFDF